MSPSKFNIPDLNRLSIANRKIFANVAMPEVLSDSKIIFAKSYNIIIPRLIEVQLYESIDKRICNSYKGFNDQTIVELKLLDQIITTNFVIPHYECKSFKCLSCNKIHDENSEQCCEMKKSIIQIQNCKLYKITIPKIDFINIKLEEAKDEFISLHFPNLMDKIMI